MADVKPQIREFILESARSKGINEVADTQSLMEAGIIDSLGIFRLVSFLEDNFRVRISDDEIVPENFQSIDEIDRFVAAKQAKAAAR
jgi:acyl carrier protein